MEEFKIREIVPRDVDFLFELMNDKSVLRALNEVPTSRNDWIEAMTAWENGSYYARISA